MSTLDQDSLPPLDENFARALADQVLGILYAAVQASPSLPASDQTKKLVSRRVLPSRLNEFETMDQYGFVVWDELMTIFDRILVYPYTASYRRHLNGAPKEVMAAWQFHSHSLRVSELYIVLDRSIALLGFLHSVAKDCGLASTDCRKSFEKCFKKQFDRRLRERHRLTHAHERPSLVSRVIDLSGAKFGDDPSAKIKLYEEVLRVAMEGLAKASAGVGFDLPKNKEELESLYERAAMKEAREMLGLINHAMLATLNITSRQTCR